MGTGSTDVMQKWLAALYLAHWEAARISTLLDKITYCRAREFCGCGFLLPVDVTDPDRDTPLPEDTSEEETE